MGYGTVYHKLDSGEMLYEIEKGQFSCKKCGHKWDGRQSGIVTDDQEDKK